jgi:hypothetical protein
MVLAAIGVVLLLNLALIRRCERLGMKARWVGKGVYCTER